MLSPIGSLSEKIRNRRNLRICKRCKLLTSRDIQRCKHCAHLSTGELKRAEKQLSQTLNMLARAMFYGLVLTLLLLTLYYQAFGNAA